MITVSQLKETDKKVLDDINHLLPQLYPEEKPLSQKNFNEVVKQKNLTVLTAKEGQNTIGMGSIYFVKTMGGLEASIEDVVVDEVYRGRGIGKMLMEKLIALGRKKGAMYIDLTSRPQRVAANELYKKLGFEKRTTNVYRLSLAR